MLIPIVLAALTQAIPPATNAGARPALQEPVSTTAVAKPEQPWPPAGVFRPGGGVTAPKVTKEVRVSYTTDAMRAKVQGGVALEAVVRGWHGWRGARHALARHALRAGRRGGEGVGAVAVHAGSERRRRRARLRPSRDDVHDRQAAVEVSPPRQSARRRSSRLTSPSTSRPTVRRQPAGPASGSHPVNASAPACSPGTRPSGRNPRLSPTDLPHPRQSVDRRSTHCGVQLACMRRRGQPNRRRRRRSRWASRRAQRFARLPPVR